MSVREFITTGAHYVVKEIHDLNFTTSEDEFDAWLTYNVVRNALADETDALYRRCGKTSY